MPTFNMGSLPRARDHPKTRESAMAPKRRIISRHRDLRGSLVFCPGGIGFPAMIIGVDFEASSARGPEVNFTFHCLRDHRCGAVLRRGHIREITHGFQRDLRELLLRPVKLSGSCLSDLQRLDGNPAGRLIFKRSVAHRPPCHRRRRESRADLSFHEKISRAKFLRDLTALHFFPPIPAVPGIDGVVVDV